MNMNLNDQNTKQINQGLYKAILKTYEKLESKEQIRVSLFVWLCNVLIGLLLVLPAFRVTKSSYLLKDENLLRADEDLCPYVESS